MLTLQKFERNETGIDYFVGDLHGMFDYLMEELDKIEFDFDNDRLFSVGDLIDRGPSSEECLNLGKADWFHPVRGNHEEFLLNRDGAIWYQNGGQWAFDEIMQHTDYVKYMTNFVRQFPLAIEVDTEYGSIGVIHAEPPHTWGEFKFGDLTRYVWGRDRVQRNDQGTIAGIDKIVVGHTPMAYGPFSFGNVVNIDTGACFKRDFSESAFLTIMSAKDVMAFETVK